MRKLPYRRIATTLAGCSLTIARRVGTNVVRGATLVVREVRDLCAGPAATSHLRKSPVDVDEMESALRVMRRDAA